MTGRPGRISAARWFNGLLIGASLLLLALLAGPVLAIPLHVPLNYNEGWNAYFAIRAVSPQAEKLYPPAASLVFDNYPPLSFYLVGALGRWIVGDMIVAGRVVSLASLLACGMLLAAAVGGRAGRAAGLLLVLCAATFFRDYLAMDDPQWLGQALMLGGLAVAMRTRISPGPVLLAALLIVAGGFVKHNLVALPIATAAYLWRRERRAGLAFIATLGLGIVAGLVAIRFSYGTLALLDIFRHQRLWHPAGMAKGAGRLLPFVPGAMAAAAALRSRRHEPAVIAAQICLGVAVASGIAQRAGAGVAVNAQFETLVALCFAIGLALRRSAPWPPALVWAVAAAPILPVLPRRLPHAWTDLTQAQARAASWRPVIARIAAAKGDVACETLALCYWAGKPFSVDFFNLTQYLLAGGDPAPFDRRIASPGFALVEYDPASPIHAERSDPLMKPIDRLYAPIAWGPGHVVLLAWKAGALPLTPLGAEPPDPQP